MNTLGRMITGKVQILLEDHPTLKKSTNFLDCELCPVHLIFILASNIEIVVELWMFIYCLLLDKTLNPFADS